jgi:hypothetical protein
MDSLDSVEFVMQLEREFGVDLPDREAEALSPGMSLAAVWRLLRRQQGAPVGEDTVPPASDPTWRRLAGVVARITETPVDDVRWQDRLFGEPPDGPHEADS